MTVRNRILIAVVCGILFQTLYAESPDEALKRMFLGDTNTLVRLWTNEFSGKVDKVHNEGVEEFVAMTTMVPVGLLPFPHGDSSELPLMIGRHMIALSKIQMGEVDREAYLYFVELRFLAKGRSIFEKAANRSGDLRILEEIGAVSYMAKRLRWLAEISNELEARYEYDMRGNHGLIANPTKDHPSNDPLWNHITNAVALLRNVQSEHGIEDETLKTAVRLGLASLARDGRDVDLKLRAEFHPIQPCLDALNETINECKSGGLFFFLLSNAMFKRDLADTDVYPFGRHLPGGTAQLEKQLLFFRHDIQTARAKGQPEKSFVPLISATNTPSKKQKGKRSERDFLKMSEEQFEKWLKEKPRSSEPVK